MNNEHVDYLEFDRSKFSDEFIKSVEKSSLFDDEIKKLLIAIDLQQSQNKEILSELEARYLARKLALRYSSYSNLRMRIWVKALTSFGSTIVGSLGVIIALTSVLPLREKITPFIIENQIHFVSISAFFALSFIVARLKKSSDEVDDWFESLTKLSDSKEKQ